MFKDGAKVIPGNTTFDTGYYAFELNDTHLGVPIEAYLSQLVGKKIIGLSSGVTAEVVNFITADESEREILRYMFHIYQQVLIMFKVCFLMENF